MRKLSQLAGLMLLSLGTVNLLTPVQAATTVSDSMKKNLEIMRDILEKSLQQDRTSDLGRIDLSYLAGQGVLFKTRLGGGFGHFFAVAPVAAVAPVPPLPPLPDMDAIRAQAKTMANAAVADGMIDEERIEEIAEQAERAAELMMEQQEALRDQNRELRDQKRELERALRDVQRERRDLEFSQKVGSTDKELQKRLKEITDKETSLNSKVQSIQQKYAAAEQELQKKRAEQAKVAQQKQAELIGKVGYSFAATLCDYGASLRELKDNEFVSLQLDTRGGRDGSSIYWVFKKSDINQCVIGKLAADGLLKKADYYRY